MNKRIQVCLFLVFHDAKLEEKLCSVEVFWLEEFSIELKRVKVSQEEKEEWEKGLDVVRGSIRFSRLNLQNLQIVLLAPRRISRRNECSELDR